MELFILPILTFFLGFVIGRYDSPKVEVTKPTNF